MDQNNVNDEVEIDLKEIAYVLLKKFWVIFMAGIGVALIAFLLSKFVLVPTYKSTTTIYIINKENTDTSAMTYSDLQSGSQLTKDYMTLVTSRPVIEQVIATLKLNMKYEDLVKLVTVINPQDTRLLNITVEYKDPFMAKQMADAIRNASSVHIKEVMDIEKVNKAEDANIPDEPASPNTLRNTIIGGTAGGFLAVFIILLIYILDDTMKTPDDIEKYLGISVLSSIPMQDTSNRKKSKNANKSNTDIKKEKIA